MPSPQPVDVDHMVPATWLRTALAAADLDDGQPVRVRPFWASPSAETPTVLIPVGPRAATRRAVMRYHDGLTGRQRLHNLAAEAAMAVGPVSMLGLRRRRFDLTLPAGLDLVSALGELLGVDDLHVAISLGRPKSNRKPVLQLLGADGRCHGWAKVAWNGWTEHLVTNEARWLAQAPPDPLVTPRVLHDAVLLDRRVVVTSALAPSRRPRRRRRPPDPAVFRAVAAMGTLDTGPVTETAWWRTVESVIDHGTDDERHAVARAVDGAAGLRLDVGGWHGDLAPWNLMTRGDRVQVIDWEFTADGAPIGFDLCHFHTQVASELLGLDADHALTHSARLVPHGLGRLGVPAENRAAVWRLYLVELIRRSMALRAAGLPTAGVTFGPAAVRRLSRSGPMDGAPASLRPIVSPIRWSA